MPIRDGNAPSGHVQRGHGAAPGAGEVQGGGRDCAVPVHAGGGGAKIGGTMTPRQIAKVDRNQPAIVEELRGAGASVQLLHTVGQGCPDILIGWRGVNLLVEIKSDVGKLTDDARRSFGEWRGQVTIVRTVEDARRLLEDTWGNW